VFQLKRKQGKSSVVIRASYSLNVTITEVVELLLCTLSAAVANKACKVRIKVFQNELELHLI